MQVDKVYFHEKFFNGYINTEKFRDLATFTPNDPNDQPHLDSIFTFADRALDGKTFIGKNVYNNGAGYESMRVGHYHSGPYKNTTRAKDSHISKDNPDGARSGPVIHYCWKGSLNELIILGYSPVSHDDPFPQIHHKNNPLRNRIKIIYQSNELIDY
ncbi:hypothetical protein [Aliivibrio sp. S10_S31]|uniref:hypothetical protein n=1 Tax=Aliivibrio sp. S10_S31 TaxID=2720224 RepID=UPI0016809DC7|nr:hypothetical protein [Aliivibrio sp. S10_S31]MBD1571540.1 hypothetical protein [Aliivibrio sp. S10_S31]